MSKHMTIINLACTITKLRKWGEAWKHSAESAQAATARMHQAHEAKMAEHRASFGARTEADAKIIEGLRQQIATLSREERAAHDALKPHVERVVAERDQLHNERNALAATLADSEAIAAEIRNQRDGLRIQVQDQREEIIRVNDAHGKTQVERDGLLAEVADLKQQLERLTSWAAKNQAARDRLQAEVERLRAEVAALQERLRASIARGDFADIEVARLKAQAPKYKVGDKLESYNRSLGLAIPVTVVGVRTVYDCQADGAEYPVGHSESELKERYVEVASHDTPAGKEAAEAAAEIKVDDVVEVVSASSCATFSTDIGRRGKVTYIGEKTIDVEGVPGYACPAGGVVSKRDVRKVPQ